MSRRVMRTAPEEDDSGTIPLTALDSGRSCEVVWVRSKYRARIDRLATYGVTPGAMLTLQQKFPTFVVRVGETDLALDTNIASDILVRPQDAEGENHDRRS